MPWGAYVQNGNLEEIEELGAELSVRIDCHVHYPAYNKNIFECRCGVIFPLYLVKGKNWKLIIEKHEMERKLIRT